MADVISILVVMVFLFILAKKVLFPRLALKRAAKAGQTVSQQTGQAVQMQGVQMAGVPSPSPADLMQAGRFSGQTLQSSRPVTCFDMRLVRTYVLDDDDNGEDTLIQRITCAVNELLLNASLRGDNVRLSVSNGINGTLMLYVTYTVR